MIMAVCMLLMMGHIGQVLTMKLTMIKREKDSCKLLARRAEGECQDLLQTCETTDAALVKIIG